MRGLTSEKLASRPIVRQGEGFIKRKYMKTLIRNMRNITQLPGRLYRRYIRPALPKVGDYKKNNIPVEDKKLLDDHLPRQFHLRENKPFYEQALVDLHNRVTKQGDDVVIIAGGYGVTTFYADQTVGKSGSVTVYEGSNRNIEFLKDISTSSDLYGEINIHHAVVGEDISVSGQATTTVISPDEIPSCDVLELDCEGAEFLILSNLDIRPREIYIELHPHINDKSHQVIGELKKMGYSIKNTLVMMETN